MIKSWRLLGMALAVVLLAAGAPAAAQAIENEFYLITPVSKDVHDPALKAFAAFVKKKYNVDLKTSAMPQGTPVAYGQIVEWKGKPQADVFWGGEGTLFDLLADQGLLDKVHHPQGDVGRDPGHHRQARRASPEGPQGVLGGNDARTLRPDLPAEAAQATRRRDQGLGRSAQSQTQGPHRPVHAGPVELEPCELRSDPGHARLGKGLGLADANWRPTRGSSRPAPATCRAWWPRASSPSVWRSPAIWPSPRSSAAMT